jgi:hypothetical protein
MLPLLEQEAKERQIKSAEHTNAKLGINPMSRCLCVLIGGNVVIVYVNQNIPSFFGVLY